MVLIIMSMHTYAAWNKIERNYYTEAEEGVRFIGLRLGNGGN